MWYALPSCDDFLRARNNRKHGVYGVEGEELRNVSLLVDEVQGPQMAAHAELAPSSSMATAARANDDETSIECSANLTDVCYISWNT